MKPFLRFAVALFVFAGLAWLGGFDFDKRGGEVALYSGIALVFAAIAYFYPD